MAIHHHTSLEDGILRVQASGFDESLEEVQAYGMAVIEACRRSGASRVLCDERELEYRLSTFDTYQAAAFIAAQVPRVGRIALLPKAAGLADARFWEDVVVNRGLTVKVFQDPAEALRWLEAAAPASS